VQAKRDTGSSIFYNFWMPVFTGMTVLMILSAIATQSLRTMKGIHDGNDTIKYIFDGKIKLHN
jgi:hypothetical protein